MAIVEHSKQKENIKLCECGCGKETTFYEGRYRKFRQGHGIRGDKNPNWKLGKRTSNGYIYILKPDHPNASVNGYVPQHRLIYEHYLKILFDEDLYIPDHYEIHHINKHKNQNYLMNLVCLSIPDHTRLHTKKDMSDRVCYLCRADKTRIYQEHEFWYNYQNNFNQNIFICSKCDSKIRRRQSKSL